MIHIIIYNETPAEPETTLEYQLRSWVKMHNTNIIISRYAYIMDIHDSLKEVVMDKLLIFYNAHDVEKGHAYADAIHTLNFKTNIISIAYDVRPETVEDVMEFPVNYLLLSPMKEHRLFNCLSLLAGASAPQYQSDFLVLKNKSGSVRFLLSEILYCCSDKRKVLIKETNGRISEFYCKLDELEEKLNKHFLRCHQSYLINIHQIRLFDYDGLYLLNEEFIPVAHKRYYQIKKRYQEMIANNPANNH